MIKLDNSIETLQGPLLAKQEVGSHQQGLIYFWTLRKPDSGFGLWQIVVEHGLPHQVLQGIRRFLHTTRQMRPVALITMQTRS